MRGKDVLQVAVMISLIAPLAQGHTCGNQDHDNRPNHCQVKKEVDGEEVWVHQVSSCRVLEPGRCEYTHCAGSTLIIEEPDCCCLESKECPGATYVGICLGTSGNGRRGPAEAASRERVDDHQNLDFERLPRPEGDRVGPRRGRELPRYTQGGLPTCA